MEIAAQIVDNSQLTAVRQTKQPIDALARECD
jgi:hypothetical protein